MSKLSDLDALKRRAERLRQEKDRAEGRLEEAQKRLTSEFKVKTVEDAEKLLKQLAKKEQNARQAFESAMEEFNKTWGDRLDE